MQTSRLFHLRHTPGILAVLTLLAGLCFSFPAVAKTASTSADQVVMMDYETGDILYSKNPHQKMPTSSMSKVMTMYLVFEALRDGRLSLDDQLPVSEKAWRKGGSKMFVNVDTTVNVEDLIKGVIVQSGNDATIVLAEGLAGSEKMFAEAMTKKARELGMKNSNFTNASGWPDPDHYSTAYDLAVMARNLIREFPSYYDYYSIKEFTYNDITQQNRNPLLYQNIDADGIKTGHTQAAGYGLIASGTMNDRRVILVINGLESKSERAREGKRLLSWGLRGFKNIDLFNEGDVISEAKLLFGQDPYVDLAAPSDVRISITPHELQNIRAEIKYEHPITAPVQKGDRIGRLVLDIPDREKTEFDLVSAENIDRVGFIQETLLKAGIMLSSSRKQ